MPIDDFDLARSSFGTDFDIIVVKDMSQIENFTNSLEGGASSFQTSPDNRILSK
jgi:hypothetical protein